MKVLIVSDIHGRHEYISNALDKFEKEDYERVIFLGDYADSYDRSNEDIMRCFKLIIDAKREYEGRVIALMGNHELHYMFDDRFRCSGFRPDLNAMLSPYLQVNRRLFQVAHQIGNHLFTHAGVQRQWYLKYFEILSKWASIMELDITNPDNLADILNGVAETSDMEILHEVGHRRGGWASDRGGITWCDRIEMESYGPLVGYHQYVGHTPVKFIEKIDKFEGGKHYNNTSVTFMDILDKKEQYLTLEI